MSCVGDKYMGSHVCVGSHVRGGWWVRSLLFLPPILRFFAKLRDFIYVQRYTAVVK